MHPLLPPQRAEIRAESIRAHGWQWAIYRSKSSGEKMRRGARVAAVSGSRVVFASCQVISFEGRFQFREIGRKRGLERHFLTRMRMLEAEL